ncbi:MAG: class I SAM-dependent methyltransferase [Aquamicrobium sp.]|uniref:class I SAM-dependent methyltransferase n=1 Tax=Aquamicrobium sp. TaxID=1872579 RepID=UPI00349E7281|nr:class I SAM-dependent methyltransferase [Aquamicrobium sp.]
MLNTKLKQLALRVPPLRRLWESHRSVLRENEQLRKGLTAKDFNHLLHYARSARLRRLPIRPDTMLSAGCAGLWYFEWIESRLGHLREHIGVEYYTPKPEGLPANVRWIENTVGDMSDVHDASCDVVFSGQNIEHIWPYEAVDFLMEAWRVLKPGGFLIMDSPNRLITRQLNWSHPEHTIELTPDEAATLCELAGFDLRKTYGVWLCDPPGGTIPTLPLVPDENETEWTVPERIICAEDCPSGSFVWWLEATKSERKPDRGALAEHMRQVFEQSWPERAARFKSLVGTRHYDNGRLVVSATANESGFLLYGPYLPLPCGDYEVVFEAVAIGGQGTLIFDVVAAGEVIASAERSVADLSRSKEVRLSFSLSEMRFGLEFRAQSRGGAAFKVWAPIIDIPPDVLPK